MSGLPGVSINILNNQIGAGTPIADNIMGLVVFGPAPSGLTQSTPKQIFNLQDAVDVGIDESYDTGNSVDAHHQIKDFYDRAADGTELWIMVVDPTTTMESACDKANDIVKKLLDAAGGKIKMWGITRVPDGGYTATYNDGLDDDVTAAITNAQALSNEYRDQFNPVRALIGGRDYQGTPGNLKDGSQSSDNRVGVVLGSTTSDGYPAVGFTLGQFANRQVQRKISRVKDGDVGLTDAYLSDGTKVEESKSAWDSIHDKKYIFFRTFANKSGYYFTGDPAFTGSDDDYAELARGRVIDKAHRLAYVTWADEVEDDVTVDANGFLPPELVKDYQRKIEQGIGSQMIPDNISAVSCQIDPEQDIIANDQVKITKLGVRPKGYATFIDVPLGFNNPA